jgi:hypothetical protein
MTEQEATLQAQSLLRNKTAIAIHDEDAPVFPYLIALRTPSGEMGVIASGRSFPEALTKARLWKKKQNRLREPAKSFNA